MAAIAVATTAQAAPFSCPAGHPGKALEHVTVFDGPPKDMASLRPDDGREVKRKMRQTWDLTSLRQIHVECAYTGGATRVVKVPKSAKTCSQDLLRLNNKGDYRLLSFGCR